MELGKKDSFVTATLTTSVNSEDEFGNRTSTTDPTATLTFWAKVRDKKSDRLVDDGKRRNRRLKELMVDTRDIEDLTIDHKLTIDDRTQRYIVTDIYEHEFKFQSTVIIENID